MSDPLANSLDVIIPIVPLRRSYSKRRHGLKENTRAETRSLSRSTGRKIVLKIDFCTRQKMCPQQHFLFTSLSLSKLWEAVGRRAPSG
ncbi:hypothetical protein TNCT_187971 [Trichonephila clavata]|uniref:Uncharacterized protein n=1 Tax=Trichonephila clavata TaxID=2740835 RepID=A0A8X6G2R3_TRICU|nr:hypothetical protein TNCT_187971 [Trichonephila clavata]